MAPGGDDFGSGSADEPVATLYRAREKARERAGKETVNVFLTEAQSAQKYILNLIP